MLCTDHSTTSCAAMQAAIASRVAYYPSLRRGGRVTRDLYLRGVLDGRNSDRVQERRDARACILAGRDTLVVAVRGTVLPHNAQDLVDFRQALFRLSDGRTDAMVHSGFHAQLRALAPQVLGALKAELSGRDCSRCRVVFTGHSMGGAVAALLADVCAPQLQHTLPAGPELYTFGCPAFGDRALGARLQEVTGCLLNVQVLGDPVTLTRLHHAYVPLPNALRLPGPSALPPRICEPARAVHSILTHPLRAHSLASYITALHHQPGSSL